MPQPRPFLLACAWLLCLRALPGLDQVQHLTVDDRSAPLAVDRLPLRLGWRLVSDARDLVQTAYQIQVASSASLLAAGQPDLWDSGKVVSAESQQVAYGGPALASFRTAHWRVRIWNGTGIASAWSAASSWSMGLLDEAAWSGAQWITAPVPVDRSPLLRTTFTVDKPVTRARLYLCGLGYHEAFLNGNRIGDAVLEPGWTYFHKRSWYVTHDVTALLASGANALGVELANGALRGLTQGGHPSFAIDSAWLSTPRLRCRLLIEYADGSTGGVISQPSGWRWTHGPVQANDWFRAVTYDARQEKPGWTLPGYVDSAWNGAQLSTATTPILKAQRFPPCRVVESLAPIAVGTKAGTTSGGAPATIYVFTFARNISGWLQLRDIVAPSGTALRISYYEPTDWTQWDQYTCKGGGPETWEPRYDYHGFNRAEVVVPDAADLVLTAASVRARRVHTDFPDNGTFTSSNPMLGRLLEAFRLSYLGNYVAIPTDCPTREKAGWMADAHLVAEGGMYYFGNQTAYDKWMLDCLDSQIASGGIPSVVPSAAFAAGTDNTWGGPAWSSAYPLMVWSLYERFGSRDLLATHFAALRKYADFVTTHLCVGNADPLDNGAIVTKPGLGDWGGASASDATGKLLIATSYHYQAVLIVARCAEALGDSAAAAAYHARAATIHQRFNVRFRSGGQPGSYSEARPARAKACALFQGLVPAADRQLTADLLKSAITSSDWTWMGCLSPRWILQELSRSGHVDTAYAAVARSDTNWGRWTEAQGLTTLREFWNGGTYNHAFMGMYATWYLEDVLGIRPDSAHPGFVRFDVIPQPPTALASAGGHFDCPRGRIAVAWKRTAGGFALDVTVPGNSRATVAIPATAQETVLEGGQPLGQAGVVDLGHAGGRRRVVIGSGTWRFTVSAVDANAAPVVTAPAAASPTVLTLP